MKMYYNRKLLQDDPSSQFHTTESNEFLLSSSTYTNTTSSIMLSPRDFNSRGMSISMALTILAIVTAILFMGLFSLYLRYISNEIPPETPSQSTRGHRRRSTSPTSSTNSSSSSIASLSSCVSLSTTKSLPLVAYGEIKQEEPSDCAVCLGEFQQGEKVKLIPRCGHLFHPDCIDKWLSCHASCPLCRSTLLLPLPLEKKDTSTRIVENADRSAQGDRQEGLIASVIELV